MDLSKFWETVVDRGARHATVHEVTVTYDLATEREQQLFYGKYSDPKIIL